MSSTDIPSLDLKETHLHEERYNAGLVLYQMKFLLYNKYN